ncbi:hypothetical protein H2203_006311 [Taxawa tesnikishii (nom. ined.)]|nr:hypothetical protein H2203_006311 [Dothideales sp. JES 119]
MAIQHSIPMVDISPFLDVSSAQYARDQVVDAVRSACESYGFFQLVGHSILLELQRKILDCGKQFFAPSGSLCRRWKTRSW